MMVKRPKIAITMGDPAGIGPELTVKVLSRMDIYDICKPLVLGDLEVIEDALIITNRSLKINPIKSLDEACYDYGTIDMIDFQNVDMSKLKYGVISAMCGRAAGEYIKKAIDLAMNDEVDATVTNPINKESFNLGGWGKKYVGHTEMYADLTNTPNYTMMLAHGNFRTVHVSTHDSLREAIDRVIKKDRIVEVIKIAHRSCIDMGMEKPRIGVAALNPHAGEDGLFGTEEIYEIAPAIEEAKKGGIDADGPIPADTIYSRALGGWYDIVVSMYHDQGHIPMKLMGFVWDENKKEWESLRGINVTLGLPIIRTSVDHGTAFGKAGKGIARSGSLYDAIIAAIDFSMVRMAQKK